MERAPFPLKNAELNVELDADRSLGSKSGNENEDKIKMNKERGT